MEQIRNLVDKDFRGTFIKILTDLGKRIDDLCENFSTEKS